jgi:hypothetical protein
MHHVKALKDLKGKTLVDRMMIAAKRKSYAGRVTKSTTDGVISESSSWRAV